MLTSEVIFFYIVLAEYGETPPLESFMEVPADIRKQELFKVTLNSFDSINTNYC